MKKSAFLYMLIFLSLAGCGDEERAAAPSPAVPELKKETRAPAVDTGTLSFRIRWEGAPMTCAAGGVSAVEAKAYGPAAGKLASTGTMTCSSAAGTIKNIPSGRNVRLVVTGKDSSGQALYRGERRGLTISSGLTTTAGTVTLTPFSPVLSQPADEAVQADGLVGFTWDGASGASGYRIQVSEAPDFTSTVADASTRAASFKTRAPLSSLTYYWRARATDAFGNRGAWSPPRSITIDGEAPANTTAKEFINGGTLLTNSTAVSLVISAAKESGVAAYHVSESPKRPAAGAPGWVEVPRSASYDADVPYALSAGDGEKAVFVAFKDALGNVSATASDSIVLDTAPPHTSITGRPADPTNSTSAFFGFLSTEAGSTFECSLDHGAYTACTGTTSYEGLLAGPRSFSVKATDAAGNADPAPASYAWTIDTTPPGTALAGRPLISTNSTTAGFSFSSTKEGSTFECRLDDGAYEVCSSPQAYEGLADGSHTFTVRAIDAAGNADPAPPGRTWTVDTTPPETAITGQPPHPSRTVAADFSFTSNEAGATFQCKLDNDAWSACASPRSYTGLAEGDHALSVKAIDAVGNEESAPVRYAWAIRLPPVNTTPPKFVNKDGAPVTQKNTAKLTISTKSDKGVAGYYISESPVAPKASDPNWVKIGGAAKAFSRDVSLPLSDGAGEKTVHVWFKDAEGNISDPKSDTIYRLNAGYLALIFVVLQAALIGL